jgi:hypothetical protein
MAVARNLNIRHPEHIEAYKGGAQNERHSKYPKQVPNITFSSFTPFP